MTSNIPSEIKALMNDKSAIPAVGQTVEEFEKEELSKPGASGKKQTFSDFLKYAPYLIASKAMTEENLSGFDDATRQDIMSRVPSQNNDVDNKPKKEPEVSKIKEPKVPILEKVDPIKIPSPEVTGEKKIVKDEVDKRGSIGKVVWSGVAQRKVSKIVSSIKWMQWMKKAQLVSYRDRGVKIRNFTNDKELVLALRQLPYDLRSTFGIIKDLKTVSYSLLEREIIRTAADSLGFDFEDLLKKFFPKRMNIEKFNRRLDVGNSDIRDEPTSTFLTIVEDFEWRAYDFERAYFDNKYEMVYQSLLNYLDFIRRELLNDNERLPHIREDFQFQFWQIIKPKPSPSYYYDFLREYPDMRSMMFTNLNSMANDTIFTSTLVDADAFVNLANQFGLRHGNFSTANEMPGSLLRSDASRLMKNIAIMILFGKFVEFVPETGSPPENKGDPLMAIGILFVLSFFPKWMIPYEQMQRMRLYAAWHIGRFLHGAVAFPDRFIQLKKDPSAAVNFQAVDPNGQPVGAAINQVVSLVGHNRTHAGFLLFRILANANAYGPTYVAPLDPRNAEFIGHRVVGEPLYRSWSSLDPTRLFEVRTNTKSNELRALLTALSNNRTYGQDSSQYVKNLANLAGVMVDRVGALEGLRELTIRFEKAYAHFPTACMYTGDQYLPRIIGDRIEVNLSPKDFLSAMYNANPELADVEKPKVEDFDSAWKTFAYFEEISERHDHIQKVLESYRWTFERKDQAIREFVFAKDKEFSGPYDHVLERLLGDRKMSLKSIPAYIGQNSLSRVYDFYNSLMKEYRQKSPSMFGFVERFYIMRLPDKYKMESVIEYTYCYDPSVPHGQVVKWTQDDISKYEVDGSLEERVSEIVFERGRVIEVAMIVPISYEEVSVHHVYVNERFPFTPPAGKDYTVSRAPIKGYYTMKSELHKERLNPYKPSQMRIPSFPYIVPHIADFPFSEVDLEVFYEMMKYRTIPNSNYKTKNPSEFVNIRKVQITNLDQVILI